MGYPVSLKIYIFTGALAALAQLAFLYHFAAPLAEELHEALAEEPEEESAWWAAAAVALIAGALWGVVLHAFVRRFGLFQGAFAAFVAFSLLPTLKWLPTPHGVSYVEPVWWREAVHGAYLLYNAVVLWILARRVPIGAAAALAVGFYAFPNFTLPHEYIEYVPYLTALQGLSITSWALFWTAAAGLVYLLSPVKRVWR